MIDGEWVAVGIRKPEALGHDYSRPYAGKPSYRFTLGRDDNTLSGYAPGETKGCRNSPTATPRRPISRGSPKKPTPTPDG